MRKFSTFGALALVVVGALCCRYYLHSSRLSTSTDIAQPQQHLRRLSTLDGLWFFAYPNSGYDQLTNDIMGLTKNAVGTNYGNIMQLANGQLAKDIFESVPIWANRPNGPFMFRRMEQPTSFIPILSHCGGFCVDCHPAFFMLSPYRFGDECRIATKYTPYPHREGGISSRGRYDSRLIKKAFKIVRPPIDNVVARFHQQYKANQAKGDQNWLRRFPDNIDGFHAWCDDVDATWSHVEHGGWIQVMNAARGVPCFTEFFRYINWHNLSYMVTDKDEFDIPLAVIHTEDLEKDFSNRMQHLVNFMEADVDPEHLEEYTSKNKFHLEDLTDYLKPYERRQVACFMKKMANEHTLKHLERYFVACQS